MNPLTNVKNITKLNEIELSRGLTNKSSWHEQYKDSAWIFVGGLSYGLTEGDVITVFSQYGEIVNMNMVRNKETGKTRGFCFICYANQKSTVLAVDNFNGIKLCGRTLRVDHVADYKMPKEHENDDEVTRLLQDEGCAPGSGIYREGPASSQNKQPSTDQKKKHKREESPDGREFPSYKRKNLKQERHDPAYDKHYVPNTSGEGHSRRERTTDHKRTSHGDTGSHRKQDTSSSVPKHKRQPSSSTDSDSPQSRKALRSPSRRETKTQGNSSSDEAVMVNTKRKGHTKKRAYSSEDRKHAKDSHKTKHHKKAGDGTSSASDTEVRKSRQTERDSAKNRKKHDSSDSSSESYSKSRHDSHHRDHKESKSSHSRDSYKSRHFKNYEEGSANNRKKRKSDSRIHHKSSSHHDRN